VHDTKIAVDRPNGMLPGITGKLDFAQFDSPATH
jgi:hypothetical protein